MTSQPLLAVLHDDPEIRARAVACVQELGCRAELPADIGRLLAASAARTVDMAVCGRTSLAPDDYRDLKILIDAGLPVVVITRGGEALGEIELLMRIGAADLLAERYVGTEVARHIIRRNLAQLRLQGENRRIQQQLRRVNADLQRRLDELQKDQQAGRQVQLKMLPDTPQRYGRYEFAHRMFPSLYLSGDYVDYFTVGDHHAAFFIADVSGHGASSAFITVLLKHLTARARSALVRSGDRTILSPAASMQRLNEQLLATGLGKHITMFGGILNMKNNTLRYCIAGHVPLPILVEDGGARYLEGSGFPVGLFHEAEFEDARIRLPERFSLMAFSDGVLEILAPKGLPEKEQALKELVEGCDGTLRNLAAQLGIDCTRDMPDDITLMRITRDGA